ncbi:phosphopentomutase [Erysipelotrichaceae bacterium OttesenSCG-928-M19]|nr:phosphopentomutase [Erysipelotrichaceae bacterium OttesenSCG-928-M19]
MDFKRVFLIVLDSLGVGAMEDAKEYNDENANTLHSILTSKDKVNIPNLVELGLGNLSVLKQYQNDKPKALYTKMAEKSVGKDTMTGHWEFMGLKTTNPFVTFTDTGFPAELISELETKTGRKVIGNKAASGTEIIEELGPEQMKTGALIVYTSADSVLQIAAHEEIIPLEDLYRYCEIAREITMKKEWLVGRVIARPYLGKPNQFKRTSNRHDYALQPPQDTVLDYLQAANYQTISVGKIYDIFDGKGLSEANKTISNEDGMNKTIELVKNRDFSGLCFVNLVDFDANYGHRRDALGYAQALEEFDSQLVTLLANLKDDDLLMLVADHGNDPNFKGSDHTREYVPLIIYYNNLKEGKKLADTTSFADVGATIAANFKVELPPLGNVIKLK